MAPPDCPEGVSPDNQDVTYTPGSVASRQCLRRIFPVAFPGGLTVKYGKSFVGPSGSIDNLYLTSDGRLWQEDILNSPGTYTQIGQTTPGSSGKSVTAFNREYIAISDGLHGSEVPLQWDGTNLDRVTQDGP